VRYSIERLRINKEKPNRQDSQFTTLKLINEEEWTNARNDVLNFLHIIHGIVLPVKVNLTIEMFFFNIFYTKEKHRFFKDKEFHSGNNQIDNFLKEIIKYRNDKTHKVDTQLFHVDPFNMLIILGLLTSTNPLSFV
jgi:hypothetical protein